MVRCSTEVLETIKNLLLDECGVETPISEQAQLDLDLGLDSVGMLALAVGLENHYRIRLEEDAQQPPRTVGELRDLVLTRLEETA